MSQSREKARMRGRKEDVVGRHFVVSRFLSSWARHSPSLEFHERNGSTSGPLHRALKAQGSMQTKTKLFEDASSSALILSYSSATSTRLRSSFCLALVLVFLPHRDESLNFLSLEPFSFQHILFVASKVPSIAQGRVTQKQRTVEKREDARKRNK